MRKVLIAFIVILILLTASIYVLIPGKISISQVAFTNASRHAANRLLSDDNKWHLWWNSLQPKDTKRFTDTVYNYKNAEYIVGSRSQDIITVTINYKKQFIGSVVNIISLTKDSSAILWKTELQTNNNPLNKITAYLDAKKIRNDMGEILQALKKLLEKHENIYGLSIKHEKVKDTLLISTKTASTTYPSTASIYSLIKNLEDHILLCGAEKTNYPMLHIRYDSGFFNTMVAIPINKLIPETNQLRIKRMVPGKILVTEVKGGVHKTRMALMELDNYIRDNFLVSPAIPFESLVTNRQKETDTSKWVTKIYYPIY